MKFEGPFPLELGGELQDIEMCYEEWGQKSAKKVILLFPSFSMSSHARSTVEDPTAGWYEGFIGPHKGIDTDMFRVICPANLGAPFGSTSPRSICGATGEVYGKSFPQITPTDMARAAHLLLSRGLNIPHLHSVIGGSLGGNLALAFASLFPSYSSSVIAMSCTGRTSPLSVGLRHIQRQAILSDPEFRDGDYLKHKTFPANGMAIARQLAMLVYKSWDAFNTKFDWKPHPPYHFTSAKTFDIESYLSYQGAKFSSDPLNSYDPNCYLLLSKASDLTNLQFRGSHPMGTSAQVGESYLDAVRRIRARLLLFGVTSDIVIPISEQTEIYNILNASGASVQFDASNSIYGHDAFILDEDYFIPRIRAFLLSKESLHTTEQRVTKCD